MSNFCKWLTCAIVLILTFWLMAQAKASPTDCISVRTTNRSEQRPIGKRETDMEKAIVELVDDVLRRNKALKPEPMEETKKSPEANPYEATKRRFKQRDLPPKGDKVPGNQQQQKPKAEATTAATESAGTQARPQVQVKNRFEQLDKQPIPARRGNGQKNICQESMAVGMLGYRMLCNYQLAPKLSSGPKRVAPGSSTVASSAARSDVVNIESADLSSLKTLVEKLTKSGNFRSLPVATAPE